MDSALYEQIVKDRPYLWWWVRDRRNLSVESVVLGVLSNGNMDDVLKLLEVLGREEVKRIFFKQIASPRHSYRPQTVNFFKKVFQQDV